MISDLAWHYFDFLKRIIPQGDKPVWLTAALAVQASLEGNSCLDLRKISDQDIITSDDAESGRSANKIKLPVAESLVNQLIQSGVAGRPGSMRPFVLDEYALYLRRYWQYENSLALDMKMRCGAWEQPDFEQLARCLKQLFPSLDNNETDWQRVAASVCALKGLCVISGGPGTGKTFTVARIIALLQMLAAPASLRIALTAPTGKAASRLAESIREAIKALDLPMNGAEMHEDSSTIHRLLGARVNSPYFRHNRNNKLNIDVLIVDEVSMVDLALMAKLLAAVPVGARVILLGDKDQLASVESGRVMGDICAEITDNHFSRDFTAKLNRVGGGSFDPITDAKNSSAIDDCVVLLTKSYRFAEKSGISELAGAIIAGKTDEAVGCFDKYPELERFPAIKIGLRQNKAEADLRHRVIQEYGPLFNCHDPASAFAAFDRFQILCVVREDETGVRQVNQWIADVMRQEGFLQGQGIWYQGRPIMIIGNNYGLGLFNGDIGITMVDDSGRLQVYFKQGDKFRAISCARIPAHETAFAFTVHKSQGSEFNRVMLMLPGRQSPVLSRELLYTAVTRAKRHFELWGDDDIFRLGIEKRFERSTGLAKRLRN